MIATLTGGWQRIAPGEQVTLRDGGLQTVPGSDTWIREGGGGDVAIRAHVGAYVELVPAEVATTGPGGVPHGMPQVGLAARRRLAAAGYELAPLTR